MQIDGPLDQAIVADWLGEWADELANVKQRIAALEAKLDPPPAIATTPLWDREVDARLAAIERVLDNFLANIAALEAKVAQPHERLAAIEARVLANWLAQRAVFAALLTFGQKSPDDPGYAGASAAITAALREALRDPIDAA